MEEQKDCRSPRSEAALPSPAPSPRGAVWSNRSRSSTPASTPRGDAAGGGEAPLAEEPKKPAKPAAPAPEKPSAAPEKPSAAPEKKPPAAPETPPAPEAPAPSRRQRPPGAEEEEAVAAAGAAAARGAGAAGGDLPPPPPKKAPARRRRAAAAAEGARAAAQGARAAAAAASGAARADAGGGHGGRQEQARPRASRRRPRPRARKAAVDIHRRAVNRWEGLEAEDAPAPAPRRRPAAAKDAVRKPPPPTASRRRPKRAPAPKKAARKKKADDDAACLREYDGDRDLRERFFGCLSVVVALLVWGAPALAYVAREPHELSAARFHDVFPKPADLAILRPPHEGLTTDPMVEWQFGDALGRAAANGAVDVEVWLDRGMVLGGDAGRVQIPPQARARGSSDPEPYRLTYDLGSLQMGIHNVTVVLRSAEAPPRFAPVRNTSLFLTPRVERDADAAAAP
ncbi:tRNA-yW synthesizing protein [Aureococcus anophagefferens]|uniref:tRNA-yW synthesizing protein n=1 Tax=Aureococcus anophagefferens TaxID=44056 RepID=A0ABR1G253_AURAN